MRTSMRITYAGSRDKNKKKAVKTSHIKLEKMSVNELLFASTFCYFQMHDCIRVVLLIMCKNLSGND